MISALLQSWWLWVLLVSGTLLLATFKVVAVYFANARWKHGPYSLLLGVGLLTFTICNCFGFTTSSLYIYTNPIAETPIIVPTAEPSSGSSNNNNGGMWSEIESEPIAIEAGIISWTVFFFAMFLDMLYKPIVPFVLIGVAFLFVLIVGVEYLRVQLRKERPTR